MRVNILVLTTALSGGGAEYVSRLMAEKLSQCVCITFESHSTVKVKAYRLHEIPAGSSNSAFTKTWNNAVRLLFIQWAKLRYRPNATISHLEGPNYANILSIGGGKRVICVHNSLNKNYASKGRANYLKKLLARMLYPFATKVIGVSLEVCDELVRDYGVSETRVKLLANPIDAKSIRKLSNESYNDWRDSLLDQEYLINVASLTDQKNHELLIYVYSRIIIQHPNLKLVLVGAGPKEKTIEQLCVDLGIPTQSQNTISNVESAAAQVLFVGYQDNPYPLIANCKVFVMTSHWEGMPISLLEAMTLGKPVVISNCSSSVRNIMLSKRKAESYEDMADCSQTEYGYLIRSTGIENRANYVDKTWVTAINELLLNKSYYESCAQASINKIVEFDIEKIANKWETLLKE